MAHDHSFFKNHTGKLVEGSTPCLPFMGSTRRLIVDMLYPKLVECRMEIVYAFIHSLWFDCSNAQIKHFHFFVECIGISPYAIKQLFCISVGLQKSGATKSTHIRELVEVGHRSLK